MIKHVSQFIGPNFSSSFFFSFQSIRCLEAWGGGGVGGRTHIFQAHGNHH